MTEITNEELENLYLSDLSTIIQFRDQELITENEFRYVLHSREDHLKKNGIVWHPYPKENPKADGYYIVAIPDRGHGHCSSIFSYWSMSLGFEIEDVNYWIGDDYQDRRFYGVGSGKGYGTMKVQAWAELPKHYEG